MKNLNIIGGLDIGNGYTKGVFSDEAGELLSKFDMPSNVAYVTIANNIKSTGEDIKYIIDDIYNKADVSFDSPAINDNNRRLFGLRGLHSGYVLEEFDVYSHLSKAKQNLSPIITLGTIAGCALRTYYEKEQQLPEDTINVTASVGLALPIREFKKYRDFYANLYLNGKHFVRFYNFDQIVRVCITFKDVHVVAEGASAQFAINDKGLDFVDLLLKDCRQVFEIDPDIKAADIIAARTTVGIDIGEGTINFPVYQNGDFNSDVSFTLDKGYGTVLLSTIDRLQDMGYPFENRKGLVEYLNAPPTNITKRAHQKVSQVLNEEIEAFVISIGLEFSKLLTKVGAYVEVIYVYGGGANPLKSAFYPKLCSTLKEFNVDIPVLYLDSEYSRFLNREGLHLIEKKVRGL